MLKRLQSRFSGRKESPAEAAAPDIEESEFPIDLADFPGALIEAEGLAQPQWAVIRHELKKRLLRAGLLTNACAVCGINQWQGRPLVLELDHINGVSDDHRLENLRLLCPNCHSQTDTYCGRNIRIARKQRLE